MRVFSGKHCYTLFNNLLQFVWGVVDVCMCAYAAGGVHIWYQTGSKLMEFLVKECFYPCLRARLRRVCKCWQVWRQFLLKRC